MACTLDIIAAACDMLRAEGFCHSPRVVNAEDFDLSEFTAQPSDIDGVDIEYVNQGGGGITGDDYHGTMAWPLRGKKLFVAEY